MGKLSKINIPFQKIDFCFQVNGEVYDGEWKNCMKHGSGLWKSPKGTY